MNIRNQSGFTLTELMIVFAFVVGGIGWILNIVQIVQSLNDITAAFIFRCVGVVVFPLGAIIGYIPF